jgi:hypothetical protein
MAARSVTQCVFLTELSDLPLRLKLTKLKFSLAFKLSSRLPKFLEVLPDLSLKTMVMSVLLVMFLCHVMLQFPMEDL